MTDCRSARGICASANAAANISSADPEKLTSAKRRAQTAAVALAHGLHASRIDGSPLTYNQQDTYMPDLLICRHEHADMVLEALKG